VLLTLIASLVILPRRAREGGGAPSGGALSNDIADPKRPVLIILHQETSTPGRVGNALRALGYSLDIRRPRFDDPLPATLDDHAGAVVLHPNGTLEGAHDPRADGGAAGV